MTNAIDTVDDLIIGAGQSGPFLGERLARSGRRVALVERRWLGGTCVNDGCMPTKTMVASARASWVVRNAARWGVKVSGEIAIDWAAVRARKDAVVLGSRGSLEKWLGGTANFEIVRGEAQFVDAHTVAVGDRRIKAERVFLNTGARPIVPSVPGMSEVPYLTSEGVMDVSTIPAHLLVLGGSYIGLEFAQMFRRFGSEVTVVERSERLTPREDEDVSAEILRILGAEGISFRLGTSVSAVERTSDGVAVILGGERVVGSHLLLAIGRAPATGSLGLDRAGVAVDERGFIRTDDELRTSQPHIYALGDVNGRGAFTHTSYDDFQIVSANLLGAGGRTVSQTHPRLCHVHRPAARPLRDERHAGSRLGKARLDRASTHDARRPRERARRERRLHAGPRRRGHPAHPGRHHPGHRGRRGHPRDRRHHGRRRAVRSPHARSARPPDGVRADPDRSRVADASDLTDPRGPSGRHAEP